MVKLESFTNNYRLEYPENEQHFQAEIKENYENWHTRLNEYRMKEQKNTK